MGLGKFLLVTGVLLALAAYALYTPLPEAYSTASNTQLQVMLASVKLLNYASKAVSFLGIMSEVDTLRSFGNCLAKYLIADADPEVKETDAVFDGVPVRLYELVNRPKTPIPAVVFYHGGGFVYGSLDMASVVVQRIAKETKSVVISVDYRMAPEHTFPVAFEDCVTATKHLLKNANKFGIDAYRVAVAGESAGGNLATVVSLKLRDEKFTPAIKLQVLIYPVVQGIDLYLPSMVENARGPLLTREMMAFFTAMYLNGDAELVGTIINNDHVSPAAKKAGFPALDVNHLPARYLEGYRRPSVDTGDVKVWEKMKGKLLDPYYSPIFATSLAGLPPAYVFSAEFDPLRDEDFLYVYRLKEAGVTVEHAHSDIGFHGIMSMVKGIPEVEPMFLHMTAWISANI